jgi:hypothetical protein
VVARIYVADFIRTAKRLHGGGHNTLSAGP